MRQDNLTSQQIDAYFLNAKVNDRLLTESSTSFSLDNTSPVTVDSSPHTPLGTQSQSPLNLKKYSKLKQLFPENFLRQKMIADGVSEDDVNAFLASSTEQAVDSPQVSAKVSVTIPFPKLKNCKEFNSKPVAELPKRNVTRSKYPKYDAMKSEMVEILKEMMKNDSVTDDDILLMI